MYLIAVFIMSLAFYLLYVKEITVALNTKFAYNQNILYFI